MPVVAGTAVVKTVESEAAIGVGEDGGIAMLVRWIKWAFSQLILHTTADRDLLNDLNTVIRQDMAAFLFRLAVEMGVVGEDWTPSAEDMERFSDVNASTPHAPGGGK